MSNDKLFERSLEGKGRKSLEKLVTALRSGKYTQIIGPLRTEDGRMCVQGVMYHINNVRSNGIEQSKIFGEKVKVYSNVKLREFWSDIGLDWNFNVTLGAMNNAGMSFEQIANWIDLVWLQKGLENLINDERYSRYKETVNVG